MYELCGSKFEDNIYCENEEIKLKRIKNINLKKTWNMCVCVYTMNIL